MAATLALLFLVGGTVIRPYVPPKLDPEPELMPSNVKSVQIAPVAGEWDTTVLARPSFVAPLVGHVLRGAVVGVRGQVETPTSRTCAGKMYYALEPFGYICSSETRPTAVAATTEPVLKLVEPTPLPYRYAMVLIAEGALMPMWASVGDLRAHAEPERQLARGDTIAIESQIEFEGASYYVSVDDKVLPIAGTKIVEHYSEWQGIQLEGVHLPFGWVTPQKAQVFDAPDGKKIGEALRRERLDIVEEATVGKKRWVRVGDGRWMKSSDLNEVRLLARPAGTGTHPQWFDVDLGEQTVVAYKGDTPVYATLTSSGRDPNKTPLGNYPIWGKATAITMKSQEYDDVPYYVNKVPWVMFFQAHNALHGAYWHDRFGVKKSHGCVNLAPRDARAVFDWLEPVLPPGWTSVRYYDLMQAPVAHIHNTGKGRAFFQERNIGPPDKNDEAERLTQAVARREAAEAAAAQLPAAGTAAPTTSGPAVVQMQPPAAPSPIPAVPIAAPGTVSGVRTQ